MAKTILGVPAPAKKAKSATASDKNCPFYGKLNVKKANLVGTIIKKDANGTATIEWVRSKFVPKYERFQYRKSRVRVHNPASINAKVGEKVLVARTRPISKTKHHVIINVLESESSVEKK
ncbi:30S ribosomal protein S17 [archaeon]|nr:30S ribosomal protein S17 [archaeon]|tara:strand:- start:1242 stop:1601 length:360 start_codon:yes stop_codon:yes gene_type:complete